MKFEKFKQEIKFWFSNEMSFSLCKFYLFCSIFCCFFLIRCECLNENERSEKQIQWFHRRLSVFRRRCGQCTHFDLSLLLLLSARIFSASKSTNIYNHFATRALTLEACVRIFHSFSTLKLWKLMKKKLNFIITVFTRSFKSFFSFRLFRSVVFKALWDPQFICCRELNETENPWHYRIKYIANNP